MRVSTDEFFKLKIAALLHDPPHKPFLIAAGRRHEREAEEITGNIFAEGVLRYLKDERIRIADALASSFDRWPLSLIMGEKYIHSLFPAREVKLKNITEPLLEAPVSHLSGVKFKKAVEGYVSSLKNIIDKTEELREKYHLLYAFYEILWIEKKLPLGPADTRVPTHSVFDHNYATTAATNWTICGEEIRGLLVGIDVVGVQQFISSSRKLRDLWASSYMVSALTWYAIAELVEKLGADIVLIPSLRMNPFYLHWLRQRLTSKRLENWFKEVETLIYLSEDVRKLYNRMGIPPYPIMPGRATLVLPPWDYLVEIVGLSENSSIEQYFKERVDTGWRLLWSIARETAKRRANNEDVVWKFVRKVFEKYEDVEHDFFEAGFHAESPLKVRVEAVEVESDGLDWSLYERKYRELVAKLSARKYVRRDSSIKLRLHDLTRKVFDRGALGVPKNSERGFDYCTLCGKLPALVVLPRKEEDYRLSLRDFLGGQISDRDLEKLTTVFSPGEKLCPWCFLKRVIGLEPRILEALIVATPSDSREVNKLVRRLTHRGPVPSLEFPSTAHLASARLYEKLVEDSKITDIIEEIYEYRDRYLPAFEIKVEWTWPFMERIFKVFKEAAASRLIKEKLLVAYTIFGSDPESLWFNPDKRSAWQDLLAKKGLSQYLWRYYTLIRADGDSIGELLEGKLTAFLLGQIGEDFYYRLKFDKVDANERKIASEYLKRYIVNSCEGRYREFIAECFKVIRGEVEKESLEEFVNEIVRVSKGEITADDAWKRVEEVLTKLKEIVDGEPRIPITPAYHVAISSALTKAALLDAATVFEHGGIVIYAGGDDLLAIVPSDKSLDSVQESRLAFGGFMHKRISQHIVVGKIAGFIKIENSCFPMLSGACRSYCIYVAHYHYPLSHVMERSTILLEESKKMLLKRNVGGKSRKDALVVVYNPRGGEDRAVIPLSWNRPIVSDGNPTKRMKSIKEVALLTRSAKKLLEYVNGRVCKSPECAVLSHSFLYDFLEAEFEELISGLSEKLRDPYLAQDAELVLVNFVKRIIKRNIRARGEERRREKLVESVWKEVFEHPLEAVCLDHWEGPLEEENANKRLVLLNFIKVVKLVRSGMR